MLRGHLLRWPLL